MHVLTRTRGFVRCYTMSSIINYPYASIGSHIPGTWYYIMWRYYLLNYSGERSIDYPAQGIRVSATYPLRFNTWGTREMSCFRDARESVSIKETFEVRFEPVSSTMSKGNPRGVLR